MVQSPSWAANWFAASQEIPRISRNAKVHYCTYKLPPPASILGQPNPVHIPTFHLLEIHLILSTHLRLGLPSGLFPSGFPIKTLYYKIVKLLKSVKIIVVAPTCFGLHKPLSGSSQPVLRQSYNVDIGCIYPTTVPITPINDICNRYQNCNLTKHSLRAPWWWFM